MTSLINGFGEFIRIAVLKISIPLDADISDTN
jgi:hypothetical protein